METRLKTSSASSYEHAVSDRCVVGVHGTWYDVTEFVDEHPGGDLLWKFNGLDASEVFTSFHPRGGVLKLVQGCKVGTYKREHDEVKTEYARLSREFVKAGYMRVELRWLFWSVVRIVGFFSAVVAALAYGHEVVAGLALAMFWQQCGGYMHDCMHSNLTYNMTVDAWLGWFFGTVCTGINAAWWKREHDLHHALVNSYTTAPETQSSYARDYGVPDPPPTAPDSSPDAAPPGPSAASGPVPQSDAGGRHNSSPSSNSPPTVVQAYAVDVQMKEDIWAQTLDVVPLFPSDSAFRWLIGYQAYFFLPAVFFLGRIGILINAWRNERTVRAWAGLALHAAATAALCSYIPSWPRVGLFYLAAAVGEGVLHLQLIVNHYLNNWDLDENVVFDFVRWTCQATHNVASHPWLDWFHVGLHLHIEHHLWPKVARCHFRDIQPTVRAFANKHGMPYRELSFFATPTLLLSAVKSVAARFSLGDAPHPHAD